MTQQDPSLIPLDGHLCFSIYSAAIAVNRLYKPLLDKLGITYPQYLVLATLYEAGEQTVSGIGERLSLDPSTITPVLKRLEQGGFILRQRNPDNERQVCVSITEKGGALRTDAKCLLETLLKRSRMTVPQIEALNENVRALLGALASEEGKRS